MARHAQKVHYSDIFLLCDLAHGSCIVTEPVILNEGVIPIVAATQRSHQNWNTADLAHVGDKAPQVAGEGSLRIRVDLYRRFLIIVTKLNEVILATLCK